jgi:tetratricopeptide (TPR) repeat protein
MKNLSKVTALALLISLGGSVVSPTVMAKPNYEEIEKRKKAKTKIMGERTGKKVVKAFDLYNEEDIDGALALLLELKPSNAFDKATVNFYLGQLNAQKENYSAAVKYMKLAISEDVLNFKDQAQSMKLMGDLYAGTKKYKEAKEIYMDWMDFTGEEDANVYIRIAQANYELKAFKDVIAPADRAIALEKPDDRKKAPYDLKIGAFYELKDYKNVVKVAETVLKTWPEMPKSWTQLGKFYMQVEDYKKGLSTMEMAYKNGHFETEVDYKILTSFYSLNEIPYKAGALFEKAMKEDKVKRTKQNVIAMASYYHQSKEIAKASKYYQEAGKFDNDAELYRKSGALLLQSEKFSQSVKALNKALELGSKKKGRIYADLADAYFQQEKYKKAYSAIMESAKDPKTRKFAKSWSSFIKEKAARKGVKI